MFGMLVSTHQEVYFLVLFSLGDEECGKISKKIYFIKEGEERSLKCKLQPVSSYYCPDITLWWVISMQIHALFYKKHNYKKYCPALPKTKKNI